MNLKFLHSNKGFSLVEVMIALLLFGVFATTFIQRQSQNVNDSVRMAQNLKLHNLAEMKMNEVLLGPREFTNATDNDPDTGKFDIEGFKEFSYKVEYKKNVFPKFEEIMGQSEEDDDGQNQVDQLQKMIFDKLKKNMEEIIWQVKVTVTDPDTEAEYELNSWITKSNAKMDTNFSF